jgi:hypothetical protein
LQLHKLCGALCRERGLSGLCQFGRRSLDRLKIQDAQLLDAVERLAGQAKQVVKVSLLGVGEGG